MPRKRERELEELLEETIRLLRKFFDRHLAISAQGDIAMKTIAVGEKATFTFTEFDGLNGTGKIVKASGPIKFSSDNPAVATVDDTQQVTNADGSISVPVVAVGAGAANITGVDPTSANKVAAGDVLTVTAVQAVALSATGVLS